MDSSAESRNRTPLTRQAVLEAARDLLVAEGLNAMSLRKIAGKLGVTAPALYAYVGSKRDLLQAIAEEEFHQLIERFESVTTDDPIERVRQLCMQYFEYAVDNPRLFQTIFLFRPELTAEPRGDELPLATEAFRAATSAVKTAIDRGHIKMQDELMASLTIWSAVHGVVTIFLSGPDLGREAVSILANTVIDTILRGLQVPEHEYSDRGS